MMVEPRSLATRWRERNPRVIAGQRSPGNVVLHSHAINLLVYHCLKQRLCTFKGFVHYSASKNYNRGLGLAARVMLV